MTMRVRAGLVVVLLCLAGCSSAAASTPSAVAPQPAVVGTPTGSGATLTPVGRRTTGPVVLRTYQRATSTGSGCDRYSQSCPPVWCDVTGLLVTELSTDAVAGSRSNGVIGLEPGSALTLLGTPYGTGYVPDVARLDGSLSNIQYGADLPIGVAEGAPVQLHTVRVAPEVTTVRLTTPDGEDSVAPADGLAALAVAGGATTGRIAALDAAGHELASVSLPAQPTASTAACRPVPPQPPTPGEQPADRAAADRAVRAAFATAFTHAPAGKPYEALTAVEDGETLHGALDQLGKNFPQAVDTATVRTDQVVFTDPRTAVVRFTLSYTGGAEYGTRNGTAKLIDGRWLVTRDTYCPVLSFGGASCP
jgi:hypothetical protein